MLRMIQAEKEQADINPAVSLEQQVLNIEQAYEQQVYDLMRRQGKQNNVSMTPREIKQLSLYEFYTLKIQLETNS